jgi:hypothetical protein
LFWQANDPAGPLPLLARCFKKEYLNPGIKSYGLEVTDINVGNEAPSITQVKYQLKLSINS